MRIDVTQEDIDKGQKGDCMNCPVALAIQDEVEDQVEVTGDEIEIGNKTISTPWEVANFIKNFDSGQPVAPFSFDLDL